MGLADRLKSIATEVKNDAAKIAEDVKQEISGEVPALKAPALALVEKAKADFLASAKELEGLRNGRNESDIPLNDPYWDYRNAHQLAHGFTVFVDKIEELKK